MPNLGISCFTVHHLLNKFLKLLLLNSMTDCSKVVTQIKPSVAVIFALNEKNEIISKGSGFVFYQEGIMVTCNHVIEKSSTVKIQFSDKKDAYLDATVTIQDREHDLALLKFDDKIRKPIPKGDKNIVKEGMPVIVSGYPFNMRDLTIHQGILSAIVEDATGNELYLIDGTINAGNSGCPLLTEGGKVIGVVNAGRRESLKTLEKVDEMKTGAISLYGVDLIEIYQALIKNLQLGIGYAVPYFYIPEPKTKNNKEELSDNKDLKV